MGDIYCQIQSVFANYRTLVHNIRRSINTKGAVAKQCSVIDSMVFVFRLILQYVRLDWETDVNSVLELIFRRWKMKQPSVIISVVSDNDRFTDKTTSKLIEWICSRLVEAAASTSAYTLLCLSILCEYIAACIS